MKLSQQRSIPVNSVSVANKAAKSRGGITIEFVLALVIAAAVAYPVIPLIKDVSVKVLDDTLDRVSPHYP